MKIRIVQTGYETFTGLLGDVKFEDGLSVIDVSNEQFAYVRSMFIVEEVQGEDQGEEVTSEGQEGAETAPEGTEVTSEGQEDGEAAPLGEVVANEDKSEAAE